MAGRLPESRGQRVVEQFEKGELTAVSLSDDVPSSERRTNPRHVTVLRVAKLITPHGEELCLVRDISTGGLMAHIYSELKVGDPVTAEFKSGHVAPGKIALLLSRLRYVHSRRSRIDCARRWFKGNHENKHK